MTHLFRLRLRRRDEGGVTIVEAAFVLPVLFALALALFDMGQWVLQTTQLSGAARDGARAGILNYKTAAGTVTNTSTPTSGTGLEAVNNAIKGRLAGQAYSATVTCVGPSDEVSKSCVTAAPDADRIKVAVSWTRQPLTPITSIFGPQVVRGNAVMQLVGQPE